MNRDHFTCETADETFTIGEMLGNSLNDGEVILLYGDLGAGKTLFTKGILNGLRYDTDEVTSPSFTLVNLYKTERFDVYHIDLWRLDASQDIAMAVGLDEIFENENAVTIIEWADRLGDFSLPNPVIRVKIDGDGDEPRIITVSKPVSKISDSKFQNLNLKSPKIVVTKSLRTLELFDGGKFVKKYEIAIGFSPVGDKVVEGDGRTPEGEFYVFTKNDRSNYHLSLGLSYPGIKDAVRGLADGMISQGEHDEIAAAIADSKMPPQKTALGGEIYIHGGGLLGDWTDGCVALADSEMSVIFDAVSVGSIVTIRP